MTAGRGGGALGPRDQAPSPAGSLHVGDESIDQHDLGGQRRVGERLGLGSQITGSRIGRGSASAT
jgi:hypothetical protein